MDFRKKSFRERLAQEPEISLLGAAFNLPTRRDMQRNRQRRAGRIANVSRQSCRRVSMQRDAVFDDEEATSTSVGENQVVIEEFVASSSGSYSESDVSEVELTCDDNEHGRCWEVSSACTPSTQESSLLRSEARGSPASATRERCLKDSLPRTIPANPYVDSSRKKPRRLRKVKAALRGRLIRSENSHPVTRPAQGSTTKPPRSISESATSPRTQRPAIQPSYVALAPQYSLSQVHDAHKIHQYPPPYFQQPYLTQPMTTAATPGQPQTGPPSLTHASVLRTDGETQTQNFSKELKRIQRKIDQAWMKLSRNPGDHVVRLELKGFQERLKSTLDTATAQSMPRNATRNFLAVQTTPAQTRTASVARRDESPGPTIRHHLCSSCGGIRSEKFHCKHPLAPGRKPLFNYCGSCRDEIMKTGVTTERHVFCYGCGVARSKAFQRRHIITRADPMLPNYCMRCRREVRGMESTVDASFVSSALESSHGQALRDSARTTSANRDRTSTEYFAAQAHEKQPESASASQNGRRRRATKYSEAESINKIDFRSPSSNLNHPNTVPSPSFRPDRRHGSAQRRAERQGEELFTPMSPPANQTSYQQPYVEDAETNTPVHAPLGTRRMPSRSTGMGGHVTSSSGGSTRHFGTWKDSHTGAAAFPLPEGVSPTLKYPHLGQFDIAGKPRQPLTRKVSGIESIVDVRCSSTRLSNEASSHAELQEPDINTCNRSTPRRVDIHEIITTLPTGDGAYSTVPSSDGDGLQTDKSSPCPSMEPNQLHDNECIGSEPDLTTSQFSRGVFGKQPVSTGRMWSTPKMGAERVPATGGISDNPDSRHSPLADGHVSPCISDPFSPIPHGCTHRNQSDFQFSRGAFAPMFGSSADYFGATTQAWASPSFMSYSPHCLERHEAPEAGDFSPQAANGKPCQLGSSFESSTAFKSHVAFVCRADIAEQHDECDATYSERSYSSDNPYYKPSRFARAHLFSQSSQTRGSPEWSRPSQKMPESDVVPEPIIEEPYSPPGSPVQPIKLLGMGDTFTG
ncbi:hypothetical protein DCS_01111 [Drechmeria coniospora]|uniref:Uncharacterized protein n=1 Tax=Drechmeria coniospora TaxID=98403 RepID=A0A151GS89_DRECN|nr:hypothetical protein DCS_01111 [Drechmeria coniospora]KYK59977.1 hypothetical protein DCS_01111 [Drechmeria coniospora]